MNDDIFMVLIVLAAGIGGFSINRWWISAKCKADKWAQHIEKVDAYLEATPPEDTEKPWTIRDIKVEILENFMYSAFDKPSDSVSDMLECYPELESLITIAEKELIEDYLFGHFEGSAHDLIEKMVDEFERERHGNG